MLKPVDPSPSFPKIEEDLLAYWKENKTFEKSVGERPEDKTWTFLDGPPFVTGLPHYGSLLSSIPKDLFPRFWTMKGYRVRRVWGWDCHGLPAENKVENKLGITRKKDIEEKVGIKKFIDECKLYVSDVSSEWEWYVDHIARWVDFKNAYRTMDKDYMETVMWVFKSMYDKELIYKGLRVSLFCPHCSTPISNFEVAMDNENYKDVRDFGTIYKYKLTDEDNTYFLAWSTTPWNKIATPALAVNPGLTYVKVKIGNEYYILAESTLEILREKYDIIEKYTGTELIGRTFEPHYDFYTVEDGNKAFIIVADEFVTADEGTGIVTLAAYGEEDLRVMKAQNIQLVLHVDEEGMILEHVPKFGGMYYLKANKAVNEDLKERGLIFREEEYVHSMPHCWRCGTQLYYAPQDAWYVDIQKMKPDLFKNNEKIQWFPDHFKHGRFLKSMESAPDWCISRSRYWGSPVPVWECHDCDYRFVPGSIEELEREAGKKIDDLHRPDIDEVTIPCKKCSGTAHRVPEVLDSWIEAGSASFAEHHFPFNKDIKLEDFFPPDFIIEYTGQIRAWFYVLHVIATALYDSHAFENVVVTGVILGTDGRKMSKNYGNYPDPRMMLEKYGGDALRLYLMGSPVMRGEDILISEEEYRNQIKSFHLPLWNIFKFVVMYANMDSFEPKNISSPSDSDNILDAWLKNLLYKLQKDVTDDLEKYDSMGVARKLIDFIDDFSRWYIRRSRDRVGPTADNVEDRDHFYNTSLYVLVELSKLAAPVTPFLSEHLYRHMTGGESVHLESWPEVREVDHKLLDNMALVRELAEAGHRARKEKQIKVRQPLQKVTFSIDGSSLSNEYADVLKEELNVKEISFTEGKPGEIGAEFDITISEDLKKEGDMRDLVRKIQQVRRDLNLQQGDKIRLTTPLYYPEFNDYLRSKVMAIEIVEGNELKVEKI